MFRPGWFECLIYYHSQSHSQQYNSESLFFHFPISIVRLNELKTVNDWLKQKCVIKRQVITKTHFLFIISYTCWSKSIWFPSGSTTAKHSGPDVESLISVTNSFPYLLIASELPLYHQNFLISPRYHSNRD